jgi:beta-galactosidase/beta-glucuronidase
VGAALTSAPLPLAVREHRLSLDGLWDVQLEPGCEPQPIVVPFTFESELSGIGRGGEIHERLRYRRRFSVPEAWSGSHVLLHFAGVDWHARVEVDGKQVGEHTGGYTHFCIDLGALSGDHELVVHVHDPADGAQPRGKQRGSGGIWYTRATGIWRPVWIEAVPATHIERFELEPAVDGTVRARVETSAPVDVELRIDGQRVSFRDEATLCVDEPRLWSPEHPNLYDVELETASGDVVTSYVAFRSVEVRDRDVLLNGKRRFLRGVLDQGYWPDGVYTAPDDEALRADVAAVKALGFDVARMHVKVADPRWYGWCDRLGLLVVQDMPSSLRLDTAEACEGFTLELDDVVEQLRGHACVIAWVVVNEDWGAPPEDLQRALVKRVRTADPSRIVVDASGWTHRGDSDVIDVHDYGDDLSRHRSEPGRPLWVGECGGVSLVVSGNEDFAYKHVRSGEELAHEYARLTGTLGAVAGFIWTQLTDVEGELNGLLTHDRRPKAPQEMIRAANERLRRSDT